MLWLLSCLPLLCPLHPHGLSSAPLRHCSQARFFAHRHALLTRGLHSAQAIGWPDEEEITSFHSGFSHPLLDNLTVQRPKNEPSSTERSRSFWQTKFQDHNASEDAIDLMCKLMKYDPERRITCKDGMTHPYCAAFHDPATEVEWQGLKIPNPVDDNLKLNTKDYRKMLADHLQAAVSSTQSRR